LRMRVGGGGDGVFVGMRQGLDNERVGDWAFALL
jgi:hypothetical protein